eukprot:2782387-Ditylum_brightwellii.AAC.1
MGREYPTLVAHKNFALCCQEQPASYAEAVFQKQPKLEKMLKKLCAQIAKCGISKHEDSGVVASIIKKELEEAIEAQKALGSDTEYKHKKYKK